MSSNTIDIVLQYHARGWWPIPVPARSKGPVIEGWQKLRLSEEDLPSYFGSGSNVGLLLGEPSGCLVDIDLDWPEARILAESFLPFTSRISGRKSSPRSHYWYIVDPLIKTKRFEDPILKGKKDERAVIVEFRSTGAQTIVPPSRHPSGELYEWHDEGDPTKLNGEALLSKVTRLAACALTARYWQKGKRHELALALSGVLIRAGWATRDAEHFILAAARVAGDDEPSDRQRAIENTAERLKQNEPTTGIPRLAELMPTDIAACIFKWLGIQTGLSSPEAGTDPKSVVITNWTEPEPLPAELLPVPQLTAEFIPSPFRDWLIDIAGRVQCPLEFPSVGAIVAVASVVGNSVTICPKRHDDWMVIPNLWGAIVGRPGLLKSPALAEVLRPLRRLEVEKREAHLLAVKEWQAQKMVKEAQRDHLKTEIKGAVKKNSVNLNQLRGQLETIDDMTAPIERRYVVNDSTVEKLGELLNQNPRGLLLFRDELTGWLHSLDREGHESDRAFYLEAWDGSGRYTYDRIGRGTIHIESVTLSMLGGIQPGPLSQYLRGALSGGIGDDGLLQRFQMLVNPDTPRDWTNIDRWPNTNAKNRVFKIFQSLDALKAEELKAESDRHDGIPYLRFDNKAQEFFNEWRGELEREIRSDSGKHPALEAHFAKYRSLMPTLALLFHLLDWADERVSGGPVSLEAAELAAAWCSFLFKHAERIYGMAIDADAMLARKMSERILKGDLPDVFTARDVYRKQWSGLTSLNTVRGPLELLEQYGWIRSISCRSGPVGGASTTYYYINPLLKSVKGER